MEIKGERIIAAKRQVVWAALNDAGVLQRSIPGCETIDKVSDTELNATLTLKVGPVKAKFKGNVKLIDLDPPNRYTIVGEGQGGVAGFGKMKALVTLSDHAQGTQLNYVADAQVGGKLAQVGSRLIEGTAAKLAQEFFDAFERNVVPGTVAETGSEAVAAPAAAAAEATPAGAATDTGAPDAAAGSSAATGSPAPAPGTENPLSAMPRWVWIALIAGAFVIAVVLTSARPG